MENIYFQIATLILFNILVPKRFRVQTMYIVLKLISEQV